MQILTFWMEQGGGTTAIKDGWRKKASLALLTFGQNMTPQRCGPSTPQRMLVNPDAAVAMKQMHAHGLCMHGASPKYQRSHGPKI